MVKKQRSNLNKKFPQCSGDNHWTKRLLTKSLA
jgi:hypothetical protein